jgi:hypothetical protein
MSLSDDMSHAGAFFRCPENEVERLDPKPLVSAIETAPFDPRLRTSGLGSSRSTLVT